MITLDTPCCALHPSDLAVATCVRCGSFTCADCLNVSGEDEAVCAACFDRSAADLLPWDQVRVLGLLRAWWRTTIAVTFRPGQTFSRVRGDGSVLGALLYAGISASLAWIPTSFSYALMMAVRMLGMGGAANPSPEFVVGTLIGSLSVVVFFPVIALVAVVALSALDHLILKLSGVDSRYDVTLRAAAFSLAPGVFGLVPVCGLYVVPVWVAVVRVFAYRGLHRTTLGRAAAGALIAPALAFVVFCGGFTALIVLLNR